MYMAEFIPSMGNASWCLLFFSTLLLYCLEREVYAAF